MAEPAPQDAAGPDGAPRHPVREDEPHDDTRELLESLRCIVDSFKRKEDFREISTQVVNGVLENLGAEYCSLVLLPGSAGKGSSLCIEGIRERRKFLRVHSGSTLLGDGTFEITAVRMAVEAGGVLCVDDVCLDPHFENMDLPSVARAVVCVPIVAQRVAVGGLIATHSQRRYFREGRVSALRILTGMLNHSNHLIASQALKSPGAHSFNASRSSGSDRRPDVFSIILLDLGLPDLLGRITPLKEDAVTLIRAHLAQGLDSKESLILQGTGGLLALLPGVSASDLPQRVRILHDLFARWKMSQKNHLQHAQMRMGFCACEDGQDLAETLEVAAIMMHPEAAVEAGS